MTHNTTIRSEIEKYIQGEGISMQTFADASKVNPGTLSGILNRNPPRPISVSQLDLITAAMGLPEGALFELYVDECFIHSIPHWRRLRPFLLRCSDLDKLDCIRSMLDYLADDLAHIPAIFDTAELMFANDKKKASALLYECVIESEKYTHSERLAISYFRLFQIYIRDDSQNMKAAVQFHLYRGRLPEAYALQGLHLLAELFALKEHWDEVETYADELRELAEAMYRNRHYFQDQYIQLQYPLVYYYGQSYLLKASCYEYRGMFEESKKWIECYADLSWFEGQDESARREVELLRLYAKANRLCIEIKIGNRSAIPEYVSFLQDHPSETMEGLNTLLDSANRHDFYLDQELGVFSSQLNMYIKMPPDQWNNRYKEHFNAARFATFCKLYAEYQFRKGLYSEGLEHTLYSFQISASDRRKETMISCMALFEQYRSFSTKEQQRTYQMICRGVREHERQNAYAVSAAGYG